MAPGVTMEFVHVPAGSFIMGDSKEGIPRHRETIAKDFYLGRTEVTQEQWKVLMAPDPSPMKRPGFPVHRVHWEDVQAYVQAMNQKYAGTGMQFALPTEAQWEYACRAGNVVKVDTPDDPARIDQYAWLGSNSQYGPHAVALKKPNDWGPHDMQGNMAEWCADILQPGPGGRVPGLPPDAPDDASGDTWHVVRGGNYRDGASACQSTSRLVRRGLVPLRHDGLRVMCAPKP
jgi:formylglycine-generating enzyme required for sulfatase activity